MAFGTKICRQIWDALLTVKADQDAGDLVGQSVCHMLQNALFGYGV